MRVAATILITAVLVTACGGSGDEASTTDATTLPSTDTSADAAGGGTTTEPEPTTTVAATTTTTVAPGAVADAISIEPAVDVRVGSATAFSPVTGPSPVAAGDVVRTDGTGFAEIAYFDGSLTRLDVDTEFEVLELVDAVGESLVRTRLDIGRTWHRVESLGESGEFSVETSVATAVVQGTAFSVECISADVCTFMVVEGVVRVDLADGTSIELTAPSALTVDRTDPEPPVPVPVPFDGAFADQWLFDNAGRDVDAGFLAAAEVYQAYGPSYGSISGTFTGTRTVTGLDCVTECLEPFVGDVADRSYTFDVDCSAGVPCVGTIDTQYRTGGEVRNSIVPVVFDGTSYRWELDFDSARCLYDNDGDGTYEASSGTIATHIEWVMTPTAAEIVDDRWVVTAMSDDEAGFSTNTVVDPGDCGADFYAGDTSLTLIEVTRQS